MQIPVHKLSDTTLTERLDQLASRDRSTTAELLTYISEFERRRLHARASYSSMHAYCVNRLRMSDDIAFKRIRVARAARRFTGIPAAIAEGRLQISGVVLLAPYLKTLTRSEGEALLAQAENKRKREIERLLAERFPRPDLPTFVVPLAPPQPLSESCHELAPGPVAPSGISLEAAPGTAPSHVASIPTNAMAAATQVATVEPVSGARLAALSPGRFAFQMTIGQSAYDKLVRLQALMSHEVPANDLERIVERALEIAIAHFERRKYGVTDRPRQSPPRSNDTRYIPAAVRRAVRERDGERCTYTSADGKRCEATTLLEFDHIVPFARGGRSTTSNLTLRCRTHNQFEADQVYGAGFMESRRDRGSRGGPVALH
jgi:hypothetical protein